MFEYPRFRTSYAPGIPALLGASNIDEWNLSTPAHDWRWEDARHQRLQWTRSWIHMPAASAPNWQIHGYEAWLAPPSGTTPTRALQTLFTPSTDWWGRTWMFCDHVVSALQLEGLWLGLLRRTGSNSAFDGITAGNSAGFVKLHYFVTNRGDFLQGGRGNDVWFDNMEIDEADLQIGDQLIIWNSFLYEFISRAEWGLENSVVMDIDSDPTAGTGSISRSELQLQGHGIRQRSYAQYLTEISGHVGAALAQVRAAVVDNQARHPGSTSFVFPLTGVTVLRWDPYDVDAFRSRVTGPGGGTVDGAWWVRIPVPGGSRVGWSNVDDALAVLAKTVKDDPAPGSHYQHPGGAGSTVTDAVYFPLFEPAMGWPAYFALRRNNLAARVQTNLNEVHADGTLAPGLFTRSGASPIAVVRARVRP